MSAGILGMGLVAPGVTHLDALRTTLDASEPASGAVQLPSEPDARLRRLPRLERMAAHAVRQALGPDATPDGSTALVFGTGYGGLSATVDFLEGLAQRGAAYGSPTAFHQSVHHSPAGTLSLLFGLKGPALTVSARELSGETALRVGLDLLHSGRAERVLVVAADERQAYLDSAYLAFGADTASLPPSEGAAALLLSVRNPATPSGPATRVEVERCELTAHSTRRLDFAQTVSQLEPLLRSTLQGRGDATTFSFAGPNPRIREAERHALTHALTIDAAAGSHLGSGLDLRDSELDAARFGFHGSAGLLRIVAAALRLQVPGSRRLVQGLALGGGQAVTVLRHA